VKQLGEASISSLALSSVFVIFEVDLDAMSADEVVSALDRRIKGMVVSILSGTKLWNVPGLREQMVLSKLKKPGVGCCKFNP
jgi:hypothetical protein